MDLAGYAKYLSGELTPYVPTDAELEGFMDGNADLPTLTDVRG